MTQPLDDHSPLEREIRDAIARSGPMPLARYIDLCLTHPEHGYYNRRRPIGADGAFTTAPEISQVFGELIGLWLVQTWRDHGRPGRFTLLELGPGRGTLMADALRAAALDPDFLAAAELMLFEASRTLRVEQKRKLAAHEPVWVDHQDARFLKKIPQQPVFMIANEFYDAVPRDVWRRRSQRWRPVGVGVIDGVDGSAALDFVDAAGAEPPAPIANRFIDAPDGAWLEALTPWPQTLSPTLGVMSVFGGAALIIDYGYTDVERAAAGGRLTLQAVRAHQPVSIFDRPGEADISAHVNFDDIRLYASGVSAPCYGPITQGALLRRLGAETRAAALARANASRGADILAGVERLLDPSDMGRIFRAMAITARGAPTPPGFETAETTGERA